jgi:hypothetical protein
MAPQAASPLALAQDVACHRCGYNVRGIDPSSSCPECNAPMHEVLGAYERTRRAWSRPRVIASALAVAALCIVAILNRVLVGPFYFTGTQVARTPLDTVGCFLIAWFLLLLIFAGCIVALAFTRRFIGVLRLTSLGLLVLSLGGLLVNIALWLMGASAGLA